MLIFDFSFSENNIYMSIKNHIPNFITMLNLLSGCIAIVFVFEDQLVIASYLIGLAAFFDFLDGFLARLFKAQSPIGKDLDSLADVIIIWPCSRIDLI